MTTQRLPTESRRKQITDAALRIIARDGLGRFTTQAIAKEVGISDGTIFRHFASKEEIVDAAIARVEEILFEGFPPTDPDPIDRLGHFFRQRVAAVSKHRDIGRVFFSDQLAQAESGSGAARMMALKKRSLEFMRACIEEAAQKGLLREGLSVDALVVLALGAAVALVSGRELAAPDDAAAKRAEEVWSTLARLMRRERDEQKK